MRTYRISGGANSDILNIKDYTLYHFGELGLARYLNLIERALGLLCEDPQRIGVREFQNGIFQYHLRHSRDAARTEIGVVQNPRHLLFFRITEDDTLELIRVLHDSMDAQRHFF